jgi:hypothetical protein
MEGPPTATAARTEAAPVLDGDVLDDPAWAPAPPLTGFRQTTPDEGQPASERTEARVLFTADTLYLGVVCFDREPDRIIVSESRRDAPLDDTDSVQVILDTYHDRQNGFLFGTNPAGIEYDAQVTNEGLGDRDATGSLGGFNLNWDAAWEVRARVGPFGWSAEFAIPFRTLRYARGEGRAWGLNVQRNIRRRKETAYWAPLSRQYTLFRLSAAGTLVGLEPPPQKNLKLTPYVLGESTRPERGADTDLDGEVGGDLKWSVTPSLALDATVNTDFAQVEADDQVINLGRFSVFFPEKRPFFLENAGLFSVGTPGEVEMFFSRRIGIGADGVPIPILAGGRLSGKALGMNVGLLDMQTREADGVPGNNYAVARLSRELPHRSNLGALFVNRQGGGTYNRVLALDGKWGVGRYGQFYGYAARSLTPGASGDQDAFSLTANSSSPGWELEARFTEVGEAFNPEVGFLQRSGYRKVDGLVFRTRRMNGFWGLHEIRPHVSYTGYWKPDGFHETGFLHMDSHWEWQSGFEFHTAVNLTREGLREPFEIHPGVVVPPGTYDETELQLVVITNQGKPVSLDTTLTAGGFLGGQRFGVTSELKLRTGETFNVRLNWDYNDVDLPQGAFTTSLLRARVSYSFTPRLFLQALVQYNDLLDAWSSNVRFGWLQSANTGLFVVFNDSQRTLASSTVPEGRSLVVKFSRLIDVLD